ncbi:MAG: glycosyltransferase family 39 protein [Candidatus Woesearchaeota archaeon]
MEFKDVIVVGLLFISAFYLYTLPIKSSEFPFGEGDAAHKFGLADWIYTTDRALPDAPFFYAVWYPYVFKDDFFRVPNPPSYAVNIAMTRFVGGDRFLAPNIFFAITACALSIITIYFLIRKIYDFWTATLTSLLLLFPMQNIMAYLWGQRPHLLALAYIPLIIYCMHRYVSNKKQVYIIIASLFSAAATVIYFQIFILIAAFLAIYLTASFAKKREAPLKLTHAILPTVLFIIITIPFLPNIMFEGNSANGGIQIQNLAGLLHWFKPGPNIMNPGMYDYGQAHAWWTLPFLSLGIILVVFRRRESDILLLSLLVSLYLVLHLDVLNLVDQGRASRLIYASPYVFYPLTAIGFLAVISFFKLRPNHKTMLKYGMVAVFVTLTILFSFKPALNQLKGAYPPLMRMTPYQYEAAQWLENNVEDESLIYMRGSITYPKARWIHMISHKPMMVGSSRELQNLDQEMIFFQQTEKEAESFPTVNHITHTVFDYSDYKLIEINAGNDPGLKQHAQQQMETLAQLEASLAKNASLIYDENFIKVYKLAST